MSLCHAIFIHKLKCFQYYFIFSYYVLDQIKKQKTTKGKHNALNK